MALTVYAALDNTLCNTPSGASPAKGPWQHSTSSFTDIGTLTSSVNVVGFVDGENRAKYFFSSVGAAPGGACALPTLSAVPNAIPNSAVPLGTAGASLVYAVVQGGQIGMLYFQITPANGSPDAGSPTQFSLDPYGLILVDSNTTPWA